MRVSSIIRHEEFQAPTLRNDIALVKLAGSLHFDKSVTDETTLLDQPMSKEKCFPF